MKPELVGNLTKARDAITELDCVLSPNKFADDPCSVLVTGLLTTLIQYHHSIVFLINSGYMRSAAALARDVIDNMYVALWINTCASLDQINEIKTEDKFPVTYPQIFEQVDSQYEENARFSDLKGRCGAPLYSYNRSGILRLGQWSLGSHVELRDDQELIHGVSTVTICLLFLASEFLAKQNQPEESKVVQALADGYEKHCAFEPLSFHKSV